MKVIKNKPHNINRHNTPLYEVLYNTNGEYALCGQLNTYTDACERALELAESFAGDEFENRDEKVNNIFSIYLCDANTGEDVTPLGLINEFSNIITNI